MYLSVKIPIVACVIFMILHQLAPTPCLSQDILFEMACKLSNAGHVWFEEIVAVHLIILPTKCQSSALASLLLGNVQIRESEA